MIENQLEVSKKKIMLGFSKKYNLYTDGCLVHALARVLKLPVVEVHDRLKLFKCFFADSTGDVCLLDLTKVPTAYPNLNYTGKFTYDNKLALETIDRVGIVIAEVDYNPIMNGTQQHFVCMVGNAEIEDSLGGTLKPSATYKTYLTLRIFEIKPLVIEEPKETMDYDTKKALELLTAYKISKNHGNLEGAINELLGMPEDIEELRKKIAEIEKSYVEVVSQVEILRLKFIENEKNETKWQKSMSTANLEIDGQKRKIEELEKTSSDWSRRYEEKRKEFVAYQESETKITKEEVVKSLTIQELIILIINKIKWTKK